MLLSDPDVTFGLAAPYEASPDLTYHEHFSMDWSLVAAAGAFPPKRRRVRVEDLAGRPLILYERGSTGRQHRARRVQRARYRA